MHLHDVMQVCGGLSASLPLLEEVLTGTDGVLGVPAGHESPHPDLLPCRLSPEGPILLFLQQRRLLGVVVGVEEIANTVGILSYGDFEESIEFLKFFFSL